jgi:hypothetical protein
MVQWKIKKIILMRHTERSHIDEQIAQDIEAWKSVLQKWLIWAIAHITRSDLKKLGSDYERDTLKQVIEGSRVAEHEILQMLDPMMRNLDRKSPYIGIDLTLKMKERMRGTLPAIEYLYTRRNGDIKWGELNIIFNSDINEPYYLLFEFWFYENGSAFIKKLLLKHSQEQNSEGKKEEKNKE